MPRFPRAVMRCIPVSMLVLAACGSDSSTGPVVTSVTVNATTQTVAVGQTLQLSATARDGDGNVVTGQEVSWSSGTPAVASVNGSGLATGVSAGTSQITATIKGLTGSLTVTVIPPPVASVVIAPGDAEIEVGETVQLSATTRDAQGDELMGRTVTWSSGNTAVATVSGAGLVEGAGAGTTQITAASEGVDASVDVVVNAAVVPVSSITISPIDPSADVGGTVQLTAAVRDAESNLLTDRTVTWSSGNTAVATVDGDGLVSGVAAGTTTITAASEGVEASVDLTITEGDPGSGVELNSVAPAELIEGQSATITGAGFDVTPGANIVRIDGVVAAVTAGSATSLTITVPTFDCQPARSAVVRVVVDTDSAEVEHDVRPASYTDAPLGELVLLSNSEDFCVQFDDAAGGSSFLIGVQSVSPTAGSRTPVRVSGRSADAAGVTTMSSLRRPAVAGSFDPVARESERHARHRSAEVGLRRRDVELGNALLASARGRRQSTAGAAGMASAFVPGDAEVGDTVSLNVPDAVDLCNTFTTIDAIVRHRGTRSIWVEDLSNPAGGFNTTQYADLSDMMDGEIWTSNTTYLGLPSDDDANGLIVIVVTKEVNSRENLLGFVSSADFFPGQCAASNGGEYYYGRAPDPNGDAGPEYATADAFDDAPSLIAHEFAHVIQIGRRISTPGATTLATAWELEGQATFAEEVAGHAFTGNTIGQNYGFATAWNPAGTPPILWYQTSFLDLAFYYGLDPQDVEVKIANAPEQCGWLGRPSEDDLLGPCAGSRSLYGVTWSFLRWISDQYGPGFPGGEAALHRALVVHTGAGFETISDVVGEPIDELLAHWAAALYLDDRYPGLNARLAFTSWNMAAIYSALIPGTRLTPRDRTFSTFTDDVTVIAGSTAYFEVSGTSRPATALSIRTQSDDPLPANMRVWIVRTQ